MPRLSDTMEEGAISTWRKHPGDTVAVGDVLVEIETDKAVMEYEAYQAGTLSQILVDEGQVAQIGAAIALFDDGSGNAASPAPASSPAPATSPASPAVSAFPPVSEGDNSKRPSGEDSAAAGAGRARGERRSGPWRRGHPADRLAAGSQARPGEPPRPVPRPGDRPRWPDHPGRHQRPAVRRPCPGCPRARQPGPRGGWRSGRRSPASGSRPGSCRFGRATRNDWRPR